VPNGRRTDVLGESGNEHEDVFTIGADRAQPACTGIGGIYAQLGRKHDKEIASITTVSVFIIGAPLTAQAAPSTVHTQTSSVAAPASGAESVVTFSESGGLVLNAPRGAVPSRTSQTAGLSNVMGRIILVPRGPFGTAV
jgi:hypothetical protein